MPIRLGEPTLFLTNWADCPFLQPLPHRVETLTFESCLLIIISLARSLARSSVVAPRSLARIDNSIFSRFQSGEENSYIIAYYYYYYYCLLIIIYLLLEEKIIKVHQERGGTTAVVATLFFLFETCVALPACSTFRGRGVRGG